MTKEVSWTGSAHVKGSAEWQRMALLTFTLIGLQFTWGVEMTYFTPHLLQLGLEKSQTSLVWIAPPLSGLIVQPIVGTVSDSSRLRWGRRRPYILVCSMLVAAFLCTLAWSSEIVGLFAWDETTTKRLTVALAVFCIYAVDFAINAVQATARSLIVDTLPESQQQIGSAWAGRMLGLGHVLGYFAGTVDLMRIFGNLLGDNQFKQICVIASTTILSCATVTCYCVGERVLLSKTKNNGSGMFKMASTVITTTMHLPSRIQGVCWITFWSWIGWSPFFVYGTTWVGETYYREDAENAKELSTSSDVVGDIARKGSLALVLFSLISFAGSILLPWIVETPSQDDTRHSGPTRNPPRKWGMDITTAWGLSQMSFAGAMVLTPISRSFRFATILIAFCGLPWAMYGWAPLAIMGEEINKLEDPSNSQASYSALTQTDEHELTSLQASSHPVPPASNTVRKDKSQEILPTAGIYLGIWNIFATIPQFLATFIAAIAFSILEPGKSPELAAGGGGGGAGGGAEDDDKVRKTPIPGLSGTAVCLTIGAICSFIAGLRTFKLRRLKT